jgi:hypothetical protein
MSYFNDIRYDPLQLSLDAMGKVRSSTETTLFDGKVLNADRLTIWENAGTGTGTYSASKYNMNVTSGQWHVRQTKRFYPYFSGKSQVVEVTFDNFETEANVVKRVGYFSSNAVSPFDTTYDGFWLEDDGTTKRIIAKRAGTETLNIAIANWTSAHSYDWSSHDWSNFNVIKFDFLWLGGAILRMFVDTPQGLMLAHYHVHAEANADVFIQSPNQPVRYEIRSSTGTGDFRYICSSVATEGSVDESGHGLAVYNPTGLAANSVGTIYALIGLKKQTTYRDNAIQLTSMEIVNTTVTTDSGVLMVIINPTLSAPLTYANNSMIQVAYGTGETITAGTGRVIATTTVSSAGGSSDILNKNFLAWLSSTLTNTHDEYVLAYMPVTANQTVHGIMNLKEF